MDLTGFAATKIFLSLEFYCLVGAGAEAVDGVLARVRVPVVDDTELVGFFEGHLGVLLAQRAVPEQPSFPLAAFPLICRGRASVLVCVLHHIYNNIHNFIAQFLILY